MMTTLITDITKNINFDDNEFSTNSLYKGQLDILKKINDGTIALSSCDKKLKAEFKNYYKSKSKYKEKENQTGKQVIDLLKVNNEPTNKDPTNIINNAMSGQIVSNNRLMPIQNFLEESSELKIECEYSQRLDPMGLFGSCSTFQALKNLKRRPIDIKYHCDNVSITGKIGGIDTIELGKNNLLRLKIEPEAEGGNKIKIEDWFSDIGEAGSAKYYPGLKGHNTVNIKLDIKGASKIFGDLLEELIVKAQEEGELENKEDFLKKNISIIRKNLIKKALCDFHKRLFKILSKIR